MIPPRSIDDFMLTFPVDKIKGLGGKLGARLVEMAAKEPKGRVTAGDIRNEFGLQGLQDALGGDSGRYVFNLCSGFDLHEPVSGKKSLLANLNSVKSFEKSGVVTTKARLMYWLHLLCVEMAGRFDEELDENQRRPTRLTLHYTRRGDKSQVMHLHVPSAPTPESLMLVRNHIYKWYRLIR